MMKSADKKKIIRVTTVPITLMAFCRGVLKELSENYEVVAISSPGKALDEFSAKENVRCIPVSMQRHISPLNDLKSLISLTKAFRKERPQMVHSMTPKAGLLSMMAAWLTGVPVRIHTFTGLVFPTATGLKQKILILTDRLTCACATHIIPEGEGVKNDLIQYRITRKPLKVLGYGNVRGIDLQHYMHTPEVEKKASEIRTSLSIDKDDFVFIYVGRLVRDKGINELVAAFDEISTKYSNVHLILVGPEEPGLDPLDANTLETIKQSYNIHTVGSQTDVRPWYAVANALVFPSYREGFPNVVIEAGAMGVPSIVTDINGSREIIKQGENGVIIPSKDKSSIYTAIEYFIRNEDKVAKMAANSRPLIASRYEQSYVRKCLKEFYRTVLN